MSSILKSRNVNDIHSIDTKMRPTGQRTSAASAAGLEARADNESSEGSDYSSDSADEKDFSSERLKKLGKYKLLKIGVLLFVWLTFTILLVIEHVLENKGTYYICVPNDEKKIFEIPEKAKSSLFFVHVSGPFIVLIQSHEIEEDAYALYMEMRQKINGEYVKASPTWTIYLDRITQFDTTQNSDRSHSFAFDEGRENINSVQVHLWTNVEIPVALELRYDASPMKLNQGFMLSLILIVGLFCLLMIDMVHRAITMVLFCTLAISFLALMEMRPSLFSIVNWINFEILLLIFSFMLIVAILSETGALSFVTMKLYKYCNGHIWPILNYLCLGIFLGSCFLDSFIMIILVAPIGIRLCEIMQLNPVPLLTCLMISASVGDTLTPERKTPHDFLNKYAYLRTQGVSETVFLAHTAPGTVVAAATAYIYMRIRYGDKNSMRFKNSAEVERLRRVVRMWERTAKSISVFSHRDHDMRDTVYGKVRHVKRRLNRIGQMPQRSSTYEETSKQLKTEYPITNQLLLVKCLFVLAFAGVLILLHLFPNVHHMTTAWTTLLAALLLLVLTGMDDFDAVLGRVEWASMLYLTCLVIFTEAIKNMGFFDGITAFTVELVTKSDPDSRLFVAMNIVLWVSALLASFLSDNAVGASMLNTVLVAVNEADRSLPIQPLLWAAMFGTSLGGLGTIIGKYANVVCAGLAEKHGCYFPFIYYCKMAFPLMLLCVLTTMAYLMIAHLWLHWH